jgi:hypothetical protein
MEFSIIPRSRWTSTAPGGATQDADDQQGIAVHWPGSTTDRYGSLPESAVIRLLNGWRDFHVNGRGWSDIGYNYAIDPDGRIWELRGMNRIGAHSASDENPDANDNFVGVLFILGDREQVPSVMIQAFRWLRERILNRFPKGKQVKGHREVPGAQTTCPGEQVMEIMAQLDDEFVPVPDKPEPEDPKEDGDMAEPIYRIGKSVHFRIYGDQAVNMPQEDVDIHVKNGVKVIGVTTAFGQTLRRTLRFEGELETLAAKELEPPKVTAPAKGK